LIFRANSAARTGSGETDLSHSHGLSHRTEGGKTERNGNAIADRERPLTPGSCRLRRQEPPALPQGARGTERPGEPSPAVSLTLARSSPIGSADRRGGRKRKRGATVPKCPVLFQHECRGAKKSGNG